jgi:diguanylate cyclase (GGDEF)-like protein
VGRLLRIAFFVAFVAVVLGAAWTQYEVQRARADDTDEAARVERATLDAVLATENAARDYTVTRATNAGTGYEDAARRLRTARADLRHAVPDDAAIREPLGRLDDAIDAWQAQVTEAVDSFRTGPALGSAGALAAARDPLLGDVRGAGDELGRALDEHNRAQRDAAGRRGLLLVAGLCGAFALLNWLLFSRTERRAAKARDHQVAFAERLQTARSEEQAHTMLAEHLQSLVPDATVLVTRERDGVADGRPIVAHGERIGTVVVRTGKSLRPATERAVHDSILRAAPVIGTLRTLAVAQLHAATDPLTGLGNRRLVEDELDRIAAHAARTGDPFAVVMIDLDHFKPVNDSFGHAAGDALLVAVADVLRGETRGYDVVGRRGGDEFIAVLPGVDAAGAANVMERCRAGITALRVGRPPVSATASIGVAGSSGGRTVDAQQLVRAADAAVYAAKARGGNCVVAAATTAATQASALRA